MAGNPRKQRGSSLLGVRWSEIVYWILLGNVVRGSVMALPGRIIAELAIDGAWTVTQLETRLHRWNAASPERYLRRTSVLVRPTAWTRRLTKIEIVIPNARGTRVAVALGSSRSAHSVDRA
jgi:hypothetical protein